MKYEQQVQDLQNILIFKTEGLQLLVVQNVGTQSFIRENRWVEEAIFWIF